MAIRYKVDVLEKLKEKGFSSYKIRKDGIINQTAVQKLREKKLIAWEQFNIVCRLLDYQPGELIEYVPEAPENEANP